MTSQLRRIVVVGNGIAGVTAADTLRSLGFDGELTLVGDEAHAAYSRPALSKALLRPDADDTSHLLPPPAHGAREIRGRRATALDPVGRTVLLDDGTTLGFDGLVIATGCRARRIGSEAAGDELTLRTLEDALLLRERAQPRPDVVVVGGGPLGMEIASSCLELGCSTTLVSPADPLSAQLGPYLSSVVLGAARSRGLVHVRGAAAGVRRSGASTVVELADGSVLEAGLVITAVGDLPNVEWLVTSGLLRDGRLETDAQGRVRSGIVAAGDVASVPSASGPRRLPLWSAAIEQSRAAAAALLGQEHHVPDPRPYFWTEQFGLSLKAVGHLPLTGEPDTVEGATAEDGLLLQWSHADDPASRAAVAINVRIPIPRLRRLGAHAAA